MCDLIAMDVTLRIIVALLFTGLFFHFLLKKRQTYLYFTIGLGISTIASIIFIVEGLQLFQGYSELARLPLCLLVIGIWGISFFFNFLHFSNYLGQKYLKSLYPTVFVFMIFNVAVAMMGLFLIIPTDFSLLATGATTTIQGIFTFGLTYLIMRRIYAEVKGKEVKRELYATFFLAIGNTTFIFLQNYSIALEIIVVCILILSFTYIYNPDYSIKYEFQQIIVSKTSSIS